MGISTDDIIKALRKPTPKNESIELPAQIPEPKITLEFAMWLHENFDELVKENETKLDSGF